MNDQTVPSDDDTTEGHRFSSSDRSIKHDVQDVVSEESTDTDGDTEGHRYYSSDRKIKHDVQVVESEDDDDTDGHGVRVKI